MGRLRSYSMSMEFTKEKILEMEKIVNRFLEKNDVHLHAPVDVFALATDLGFDVRAAYLPGTIEGLVIVDENLQRIREFNANKVIAYNIHADIKEKRFIVAHELAHYIEKKQENKDGAKIVVAARDHERNYSENEDEQRKDYIAASILVPMDDLKKRFDLNEKFKDYEKIADFYRVSIELARRRVGETLRVS